MVLFKLRLRVKAKSSRGTIDPKTVFNAIIEKWADLQNELGALEEGDKDGIQTHFNELIEGADDLGDVMLGQADEFQQRTDQLEKGQQEKLANELVTAEIIVLE